MPREPLDPNVTAKIEFDRVYTFRIGGFRVVFGRMTRGEASAPTVYAAALSETELHREDLCGYGPSEAAAASALFQRMSLLWRRWTGLSTAWRMPTASSSPRGVEKRQIPASAVRTAAL